MSNVDGRTGAHGDKQSALDSTAMATSKSLVSCAGPNLPRTVSSDPSEAGNKVVFFGHHKCGSRFFRESVLPAFARENAFEEVAYEVTAAPFHHRNPVQLDLCNLDLTHLATECDTVIYVANAGSAILERANSINPDYRGLRIIRDPRQILVSCYFHHLKGHNTEYRGWVWDQLIEDRHVMEHLTLEEGLIYEMENISGMVLRDQIFAWQPSEKILEFKLEEIDSDFDQVMRTLSDFLGFEQMPTLDSDKVVRFANPSSRHWSSVFTPRVTDLFKKRFGEDLIRLGYEADLDW